MPKMTNSKTVLFPTERIYQKVMNIEAYPDLLSFIRRVEILERFDTGMLARVHVGLPGLTFSYDCRITYKEPEYVRVMLVSGPFKKLEAYWEFEPIGTNSCKVTYSLDSEFKNFLMEKTAGTIFAIQIDHSIKVFEEALERS